ncbi:NVEALA domain-containing protein [Proteiniphilum saccharofermentans]|uniref:NVEALA domain-containing protein n=1 Tax=Proteiniphilum saccharofermentans TaxID=1642647 RepID=UPI0028A91554|nr:NVEALA domain-containing protein [Proteiniphilum saccharofermentans]
MRKKILSGLFALVLLVATGYGVSQNLKSDTGLSDLALMNAEALANGEVIIGPACMNTCSTCWCIWLGPGPGDYYETRGEFYQ